MECYSNLTQSQAAGFLFENILRQEVFGVKVDTNNTDIHDIPAGQGKNKNVNENISIKFIKENAPIYCGDIMRFLSYNHANEENTILFAFWKQEGEYKVITRICEINYCKELREHFIGNLPLEVIVEYIDNIKKLPLDIEKSEKLKIFDYKNEKKKIQNKYPSCNIQINPKVSKTNRRVQASIRYDNIPEKYIKYDSKKENSLPNVVRGITLSKDRFYSPPRKRGGLTKSKLKDFCKKKGIKKYSSLKKNDLIDFILSKGYTMENLNAS